MILYAIKDVKAGFQTPQEFVNDEVAIRAFKIATSDPRTMLGQVPADFELWKIGEFDLQSGELRSDPQFLCNVGGSNV